MLTNRINICRRLALRPDKLGGHTSFGFNRNACRTIHSMKLKSTNIPIIVNSTGAAARIAKDLLSNYSLAWHPENARDEPVYLLVHKFEFEYYRQALSKVEYKNFYLISWDGGQMSGFGAARAAAMAFADALPYRPKQILLMDQDVILTEQTRHTNPVVKKALLQAQIKAGYPQKTTIIGFGKGNTKRVPVLSFKNQLNPPENTRSYTSRAPIQQIVAITAPFVDRHTDGIYPSFMVAGGEDMLMNYKQGLITRLNGNTSFLDATILKKELAADSEHPEPPNPYWGNTQLNTLKKLYDIEKGYKVSLKGFSGTIEQLILSFIREGVIKDTKTDIYNTSANIVERILIFLYRSKFLPSMFDDSVFDNKIS